LLKEFTEDGRRRYLVGRRRPGDPELPDTTFRFDVEVTQWNGVPIARAIERFAERIPGATSMPGTFEPLTGSPSAHSPLEPDDHRPRGGRVASHCHY
jgi:hypothetical protein